MRFSTLGIFSIDESREDNCSHIPFITTFSVVKSNIRRFSKLDGMALEVGVPTRRIGEDVRDVVDSLASGCSFLRNSESKSSSAMYFMSIRGRFQMVSGDGDLDKGELPASDSLKFEKFDLMVVNTFVCMVRLW